MVAHPYACYERFFTSHAGGLRGGYYLMQPALRSPSRLVDLKLKKAPLPDSRAPSRFNQLTDRQPSAAIFRVRMVTTRVVLVANPRGKPARATGW
jgi:hypothetical protein